MEYTRKELDINDQAWRKKILPYEKGRSCVFLDGRIVRNVEYLRASFVHLNIPGGFAGLLAINLNTPDDRVTYLESVQIDQDEGTLYNTIGTYIQLMVWANNNRINYEFSPTYLHPVRIYVPPRSSLSFHFLAINFPLAPVFVSMNLKYMQFTAHDDIWDYGVGSGAANPPVWTV